jgi:hypothetical protein
VKRPKHGLTGTRIYGIWQRMKKRCYTANFAGFAACGGRGIQVCEQWRHDLAAFVADVSQLEHYDCAGFDLYRIDLERDYEPGNVRFVPAKERARNRQGNRRLTFQGKTQCLMDWAEDPSRASLGINYPALVSRLRHGWSVERALTTPLNLYRSDNMDRDAGASVTKQVYRPFYYYERPGFRGVLCELDSDGYVYMSHNDQVIHRSKYSGQFVMLVELHPEPKGENYGN